MSALRIAVVVGSIRKDSYNRRFAEALARLAPAGVEFNFLRIDDLPHYNQDDDNEGENDMEVPNYGAPEATTVAPPLSATDMLVEASHLQAKAAQLRAAAAEQARLAEEARKPKMPDLPNHGDVQAILFTKYQGGREYHYAALGWRIGHSIRWTVTGACTDRFSWAGLLEFVGEANWSSLAVVETARSIGPTPGNEGPVAERMGESGRVTRTEDVSERGFSARGGFVSGR